MFSNLMMLKQAKFLVQLIVYIQLVDSLQQLGGTKPNKGLKQQFYGVSSKEVYHLIVLITLTFLQRFPFFPFSPIKPV